MVRVYFISLLIFLTSCTSGAVLPSPPYTHEIVDNPYLKLMWSMDYPVTRLAAAPDRVVLQGHQGLAAIETWSRNAAWSDATASSGKLYVHGPALYRSIYNGLEAYDLQSGRLLWKTRSLQTGNARSVFADDNNVFLAGQDGRFLEFDRSGRFLRAATSSSGSTPLLLEGNTLYSFTASGLYSSDASTSQLRWKANIPGIHDAVVADKNTYVDTSSFVYAVTTATGKLLWHAGEQSAIVSNLCLLDTNLFFLTGDGRLVVLSTRTGRQVTSLPFTNAPFSRTAQPVPSTAYFLAADPANEVLLIAFGDTRQIIALKLLGGREVFIEKPLYR